MTAKRQPSPDRARDLPSFPRPELRAAKPVNAWDDEWERTADGPVCAGIDMTKHGGR